MWKAYARLVVAGPGGDGMISATQYAQAVRERRRGWRAK